MGPDSEYTRPLTRVCDAADELAGSTIPDPYRWLEDDSEETRQWQAEQAALAARYVRDRGQLDAVRESVLRHRAPRFADVPVQTKSGWFRSEVVEGVTRVVVGREPYRDERIVVEFPAEELGSEPPSLPWFAPSPDGEVLAVGICRDGSEHNQIALYDVRTGARLPDSIERVLHDGWVGGVVWLPDSKAFFYLALVGPLSDFRQEVFYHRLGEPAATEPEKVPLPEDFREYILVQISDDGRWATAVGGRRAPVALARCRLTAMGREWEPFVTVADGAFYGHIVGDDYVAVTTVGADRGRMVSVAMDSVAPADPGTWREIVGESDAVIRGTTRVGDELYVSEWIDTYSRVRVISPDGAEVCRLELPGKGAAGEQAQPLMQLVARVGQEHFVFPFATFTASWGVYRHDRSTNRLDVLREPAVRLDGVTVEDRWATSADGTRVPYHVVSRSDVAERPDRPTLVYAHGGFNVGLSPVYQIQAGVIVDAGGTYVHAHLRGGGEFGLAWWNGGRRDCKQNTYDDLYAVAEDLIASGTTSSSALGLTGFSNGGLTACVAVTQRPSLWRVAVPRVPITDLLGAFRSSYLSVTAREFGETADADGVAHLMSISPYHLVRDGTDYPAVYVDAGVNNPRCPPWQARKWAARMQAAQAGTAPILLHIWNDAGHGWATPVEVEIAQETEWLAFVLNELGVRL
ncbi:prolyl endopeptidase [Acrocarpospora pleiomorpha]|uniref:prolyl oligopeptidase n=1 Tax=Acrocarpospora pleiomorpha TaxID=90975 RepID=A0A5M3XGU8_9ACTN|nr:prolyl oligopeptidase family serine peptidase [Acrocarpospora pleiomorpha]GES20757.1 prolyl endopeptidase [Acrocarpospora pleiomorpha]